MLALRASLKLLSMTRLIQSRHAGFTLVEIMIVLVIIGLLAAMGIPALMRVKSQSQYTAAANDLRTFTAAFNTFSMEEGMWPAESASGVVPIGMEDRIKSESWAKTTLGGAHWDWQNAVGGISAGIAMTDGDTSDSQLAEFDALIDDGNITTGRFRRVSDKPTFVIIE